MKNKTGKRLDGKISVYKITNLINGELYVGITGQKLIARACTHRNHAMNHRSKAKIGAAIRKYGFDMFRFSILALCDSYDGAYELEKKLIAAWKPRYNTLRGGGHDYDEYWTERRRKEWSDKLKGLPPRKFNGYSAAAIESYKRAGRRNRDHWMSVRHNGVVARMRKIVCLDDGTVYESGAAAAAAYGLHRNQVVRVCSGAKYRKTAGGRRFAYADNKGSA